MAGEVDVAVLIQLLALNGFFRCLVTDIDLARGGAKQVANAKDFFPCEWEPGEREASFGVRVVSLPSPNAASGAYVFSARRTHCIRWHFRFCNHYMWLCDGVSERKQRLWPL